MGIYHQKLKGKKIILEKGIGPNPYTSFTAAKVAFSRPPRGDLNHTLIITVISKLEYLEHGQTDVANASRCSN